MFYDVIIVGGGISGLIASIALNKCGLKVLVLEKKIKNRFKIGESIHPNGKGILKKYIGSLNAISSIIEYPYNKIRWSSNTWSYQDFIFNPNGNAISVDRCEFESYLKNKSISIGNELVLGAKVISYSNNEIICSYKNESRDDYSSFRAKMIFFSTGRASIRGLSEKRYFDKLLCLSCTVDTSNVSLAGNQLIIEAIENGWLYTNQLPNNKQIISFFTDSDLIGNDRVSLFKNALAHSNEIKLKVEKNILLRVYDARTYWDSFKLPPNSLFLGEALYSIDPLSGYGISKNLEMIDYLVDLIIPMIDGKNKAFENFANFNQSKFNEFQKERSLIYSEVTEEYTKNEFWGRRQGK